MSTSYQGTADEIKQQLADDGMEYGLSIGRRSPMHRMHVDCIEEIAQAGLKPVVFIGSTNGPDSRFYDPVRNPMTAAQQQEQLAQAIPQYYDPSRVILQEDTGNPDSWFKGWLPRLEAIGARDKTVTHYRAKASDKPQAGGHIRQLSSYTGHFADNGIGSWQSYNRHPEDDNLNATELRTFDLEHLTSEQHSQFAAPDYIIRIAREARDHNPDKALLDDAGIPVTMFDLSLERFYREAGVSTAAIVEKAGSKGAVTLESLTRAATGFTPQGRDRHHAQEQTTTETSMTQPVSFQMKIASASCNQTGGDWPRNLRNICKAIDMAVADGADVLGLEELGLTGYERGDDFYYSDNAKTHEMLQLIADYAASKDPNLLISIGNPWYFADKSIPDQDERRKNPIYNRLNNNFNAQTFIAGGEIVSMSDKRYLFNYERGYEKRHFEEWSDTLANQYENRHGKGRDGTIRIELPELRYEDGSVLPAKVIPFGSPVVQIGEGAKKANFYHMICEEYWIGSRFDGSGNNNDYHRDSPLAQKARDFDITVTVNPNASPPVASKIDKHYELCKQASEYCDVIVHTDGLGSSGATFAQFGSRLMAQDGKIISEGVRNSFKDVAYTSQVVTVTAPVDKGHAPHAVIPHHFREHYTAPVQDGPAAWEKGPNREMEEEMRNETLWLFDYMRKNRLQGISQALSGGADSAYNATKVRLMVELATSELGVEGFFEAMPHLKFRKDVLEINAREGKEAAVRSIADHMLASVYMGTDNSSLDTLRAAFTLVVGGTQDKQSELYRAIDDKLRQLIAGTAHDKDVVREVRALLDAHKGEEGVYEGIGGEFHYRNVQRLVEVYAEIFSGVNPGKISDERDAEIRKEIASILRTREEDITPEELEVRVENFKATFEEVSHDVLSVANPDHQLAYENIQARLRQVLIMLFSNVTHKIAIANPNLDEGRNSYATWGGDLHGGMISGNAHKNKARELEHMQMLYEHGLEGAAPPVHALHWALKNRPSAELQPLGKDGKVTQFDEDQLGRSFEQMHVISHYMLYDRPLSQQERKNNPIEVFEKCKQHPAFAGDDIETLHDRIRLSYDKWAHAQFKIHGSPVAATYGKNIDKQSSLRTPNISAYHKPELAQLALYTLDQMAQRDGSSFEALSGGKSFAEMSKRALLDSDFASALTAKMWTPQAIDGRKNKVSTLYAYVQEHGLDALTRPNPMADILERAGNWRKRAVRGGDGQATGAAIGPQ